MCGLQPTGWDQQRRRRRPKLGQRSLDLTHGPARYKQQTGYCLLGAHCRLVSLGHGATELI